MKLLRLVCVVGTLLAARSALADCPPCGPMYCTDTPAYKSALERKKARLQAAAEGYPKRLIDLYDRVDKCEGCVATGPDGFRLLMVPKNGDGTLMGWSADIEDIGARQVAENAIASCHVLLSRHSCACCNRPRYDSRPDYDKKLDLSKSMALPCQRQ